jgi:hypothetical protein
MISLLVGDVPTRQAGQTLAFTSGCFGLAMMGGTPTPAEFQRIVRLGETMPDIYFFIVELLKGKRPVYHIDFAVGRRPDRGSHELLLWACEKR